METLAIALIVGGFFWLGLRGAGEAVDAEKKRIERELADLKFRMEDQKQRAEYLRTHNNIPAWYWKD